MFSVIEDIKTKLFKHFFENICLMNSMESSCIPVIEAKEQTERKFYYLYFKI